MHMIYISIFTSFEIEKHEKCMKRNKKSLNYYYYFYFKDTSEKNLRYCGLQFAIDIELSF